MHCSELAYLLPNNVFFFFLSERGELGERFTGASSKQDRGDGGSYGDSGGGRAGVVIGLVVLVLL